MNFRTKILEYSRLIRLSTAGNEIGVILFGGFIMGQREIPQILLLILFGLIGHIFGYTLNEYADIEVDKKLKYDIKKPLVSGVIPKQHALIISFSACILAYILVIIFYPNLLTMLLLTIAVLLTILYDFFGKKIPLSDFIVAGTLGIFLLFGASTVSSSFPTVIYLASLVFFFDVVFMNFVEGGLKDIDHDSKAGAKTMATRLGVSIKENKLFISTRFKIFAYALRAIYFSLIILIGFQPESNLWFSDISIIHIIAAILMIIVITASYRLLHFPVFDKTKMYKLFAVINTSSVFLLIIMLYPILGFWVTLTLFSLPLLWYIILNHLMYERALQPLV
jgi:4-hydroxybenzoate polyprenyltransferase